ncbi:type IV secretion system protein [Erythrobacter aureus]|uniref:Type IV secretion system protein VirB5 n=1 Tax=Erythrobacter aureus TaxID=2182384 RepID=A0A345YIM9_9SPHN|nr:type IV secretion system protein [Erythrobacter aureus]AXK43781.1 hypothetical protein DVR09_15100 [Erythrobacter aureus]
MMMLTKKARALFAAAAAATVMTMPAPASAGIPVIDPTAIARIREVVSTASQQLAQIRQQVQQVNQMRNTIGQVGKGQLDSIMQQSGIDMAGAKGILRDVQTLGSTSANLGNAVKGLKIDGEGSLNIPTIDSLGAGRDAASKIFFYGGSESMNMQTVRQLRDRRNIALRETAITGFGAAASFKSDLAETQQIADKLSAQASESTDLRTDVQVNTATLLAMYAEMQKQTAIQAQLLELDASRTLAGDATAKRN